MDDWDHATVIVNDRFREASDAARQQSANARAARVDMNNTLAAPEARDDAEHRWERAMDAWSHANGAMQALVDVLQAIDAARQEAGGRS